MEVCYLLKCLIVSSVAAVFCTNLKFEKSSCGTTYMIKKLIQILRNVFLVRLIFFENWPFTIISILFIVALPNWLRGENNHQNKALQAPLGMTLWRIPKDT